jgi:hypothetical protein
MLAMKKVLSVALVVAMLATMITVFPVSADGSIPKLVITEICVDTYLYIDSDGTGADVFEYIEVFNSSNEEINLYDYAITLKSSINWNTMDPETAQGLTDFTPICSPETMITVGNTLGTIATNTNSTTWQFYPTNPSEDGDPAAYTLQPGEVAVIWLYTFDAYGFANYNGRPYTFEDFRHYWNIDDSIKVLAIDANGGTGNTSIKDKNGVELAKVPQNGSNGATNDLMTELYPSAAGRFNGANTGRRVYGIMNVANLKADNARTEIKLADLESYCYVSYENDGLKKNLLSATLNTTGAYAASYVTDSLTYNFKYHSEASKYEIEKAAGNLKYADWDLCRFPTPGTLQKAQVEAFEELGMTVPEDSVYQSRAYEYDPVKSIQYIIYQENFYGIEDSDDSDKILEALGWVRSPRLNNGGTARFAIENEKLVAINLDIDQNEDGKFTGEGELDSTDSLFVICPSLKMDKIAKSTYTIEYDLMYVEAQEGNRYVCAIYNYNGLLAYDIFILRVRGTGNNQRRLRSNKYITYDTSGTDLYAPNDDKIEGQTSIVYKITGGEVKAGEDKSTDPKDFKLLNRELHVKYEVDLIKGTKYYVNDVLVSQVDEKSYGYAYWGAQANGHPEVDFAVGFIVTQRVKATIDNIKITGYVNEYTEADILRAYDLAPSKEPTTGDATIYVTIAMAVSFISLAALVVTKRKGSRVK